MIDDNKNYNNYHHHQDQQQQQQQQHPALPSWCQLLKKESTTSIDSNGKTTTTPSKKAYDERIITSTKSSELRLRNESIRYWNQHFEISIQKTFQKLVQPTCHSIIKTLLNLHNHGDNGDGDGCSDDDASSDDDDRNKGDKKVDDKEDSNDDDEWEYCQNLFGLPKSTSTSTSTSIQYPFEIVPLFILSSTLISNCLNDRLQICHTIWNELNFNETNENENSVNGNGNNNNNTNTDHICLHIPRLLSSWTETLQLIWDALINHFEDTHIIPKMDYDVDTSQYHYSNVDSGYTKKHSYNVSKRKHYEHLVDRKGIALKGTASKRQQSIQEFILEYLKYIHDDDDNNEPATTASTAEKKKDEGDNANDSTNNNKRKRKRQECQQNQSQNGQSQNGNRKSQSQQQHGNLILLLEDPRVIHSQDGGSGVSSNSIVQTQLLETVIEWRTNYGIPISLIVLNSIGSKYDLQSNNILLNPSNYNGNGGRFGIRTIRCQIPQSSYSNSCAVVPSPNTNMGTAIWCQYFLNEMKDTPMPLLVVPSTTSSTNSNANSAISSSATATNSVMLRLCQDTLGGTISCTTFSQKLKLYMISNFFIYKGSFVWNTLYNSNSNSSLDLDVNDTNPKTNSDLNSNSNSTNSVQQKQQQQHQQQNDDQKHLSLSTSTSLSSTASLLYNMIGTDNVNIYQPEFVAWFCSYHNAQKLLSSCSSKNQEGMSLNDKCNSLLYCYNLLKSKSKKSNKNNHDGYLQFWWKISCSLLPLHILSLTTTSTTRTTTSTENENENENEVGVLLSSSGHQQYQQQYSWTLEQLADVYKQIEVDVDVDVDVVDVTTQEEEGEEEGDEEDVPMMVETTYPTTTTNDDDDSIIIGGSSSEAVAAAVATTTTTTTKTTTTAATAATTFNETNINNENEIENNDDDQDDDQDHVERTLRRYLQRGIIVGGDKEKSTKNNNSSSSSSRKMNEIDQQQRHELITIVRQMIVFVEALRRTTTNTSNNNTNKNDDKEDEEKNRTNNSTVITTSSIRNEKKIRRGITETILKINHLVLERVEFWTRRWIEINPLMPMPIMTPLPLPLVEEEEETRNTHNNSNNNNINDGRPINFRRRILDNLPYGSRQLYELLEGRLSVDRDDWYNTFGGTVEDFAIGVWTLRKCGLIRPTKKPTTTTWKQQQRGKQQNEVITYEKVAVVWC
jgi:hypothetical protein